MSKPSSPALSQDIFFDEEFPKINDDLNNFFEIIDKIPQELKSKKIDKLYEFFDNSIENFKESFIKESIKEPNSKIEENLAKIITAVKEINSRLEKIDASGYDIDELKSDFLNKRAENVLRLRQVSNGEIGQERTREWLARQALTASDTDKKGNPSISDSPRSSSSFDSPIGSSISFNEGILATEPPTTPIRQRYLDQAREHSTSRKLNFDKDQNLSQDTTSTNDLSAIPENSPRGDNFGRSTSNQSTAPHQSQSPLPENLSNPDNFGRSTSNQSIAPDIYKDGNPDNFGRSTSNQSIVPDIAKKSEPDPENLIYDTRRNFYVLYKGSKDRVIFFDSIKDIADDFTKHFNSLDIRQRRELLGKKIKPWGDEKTLKISYEEDKLDKDVPARSIQLEFHDKFNKKQVIEFKILAEQIQSYKTIEQLSNGAVEQKTKDFPVELTALPLNNSNATQSFISQRVITQNQGFNGYNLPPHYYTGQNGYALSYYQPFSIYQQGYITPATTQSSLSTNPLMPQQPKQISEVYTSATPSPQFISYGRIASYQSFYGNGNFVR